MYIFVVVGETGVLLNSSGCEFVSPFHKNLILSWLRWPIDAIGWEKIVCQHLSFEGKSNLVTHLVMMIATRDKRVDCSLCGWPIKGNLIRDVCPDEEVQGDFVYRSYSGS